MDPDGMDTTQPNGLAEGFDRFIHPDEYPPDEPGGPINSSVLLRRMEALELAYNRVDSAVDLVRATQIRQETAIQALIISVDAATALLHSIKLAVAKDVAHNNMLRDNAADTSRGLKK